MTSFEGGFEYTPSFYRDESTFIKYLGQTSYYQALQQAALKVVSLSQPRKVLELGIGTGATAMEIARLNSDLRLLGVDNRQSMVTMAANKAKKEGLNNAFFEVGDMHDYGQKSEDFDLIVMLYSFHHLLDPLSHKVSFLQDCFNHMRQGNRICVAEAFLPEASSDVEQLSKIYELWSRRVHEGYASTFWASLSGLSDDAIEQSRRIGKFSFEYEKKAGDLVAIRDSEYLVSMSWLVDMVKSIGFKVLIAEPVNAMGDGLVLLEK